MSHRDVPDSDVEADVRSSFGALLRKLPFAVLFAAIVAGGTYLVLSRMDPVYRAGATVLIVPGQTDAAGDAASSAGVDSETIGGQVQLVRSRDLAKAVADKIGLAAYPEFDPRRPPTWFGALLATIGFHAAEPASEERVLAAYYDRLSVYPVDNSRVIGVDFASIDPELAALVANTVVDEYIGLLRAARQNSAAETTAWLAAQIAKLRVEVQAAEAGVERYRTEHDLFLSAGAVPVTLSQQQLSDLNAELATARAARADAEARMAQIRSGTGPEAGSNLPDVVNAPLIQRLIERRGAARSEHAQLSATLPPLHPRLQAVTAQIAEFDRQITAETARVLRSVEAEAGLARDREAEIERRLTALKAAAAEANDAAVGLRALEREAAAQRELLDTYLARQREAMSRVESEYLPADARVVSRAGVPIEPDFPRVVPMTITAAVGAFLLARAFLAFRELAIARPVVRRRAVAMPTPEQLRAEPCLPDPKARWADDKAVRRMMPKEPTLVPEMVSGAEQSLAAIAGDIVRSGHKRILVTLAEGSDAEGRPLGAVALARALARTDARVVLVDFRSDGANAASMGEGSNVPGFSDLFEGDASFAQVIFRDRRSRVHFIPAGRRPLAPALIDPEQMETILSALTLTYDYVLLDAGDDMIAVVGPACGAAVVVSEHDTADRRTAAAVERIKAASSATVLLLFVDPAADQAGDVRGAAA